MYDLQENKLRLVNLFTFRRGIQLSRNLMHPAVLYLCQTKSEFHCNSARKEVLHTDRIIRIFNGCEVRIENSVTRTTVRHYEAHRVTESSIRTEKPLLIIFLAYSSFDDCI